MREKMGWCYLDRPLWRREEREGGGTLGGREAVRALAGTAVYSGARAGRLLYTGEQIQQMEIEIEQELQQKQSPSRDKTKSQSRSKDDIVR